MPIILKRMIARGPGRSEAEITFAPDHSLVRGPSDTGKSYIRAALWYLLDGDKPPKRFPENEGYDALILEFEVDGVVYSIMRSLVGGGAAVFRASYPPPIDAPQIEEDVGQLLVNLSGAGDKQILRTKAKRGPLTGGDLRHWFLQSQTDSISESPTTGENPNNRTQRAAAFHVFLTGSDDSAIVLDQTKAEKDAAAARLTVTLELLASVKSRLPNDLTKVEVVNSLERVDDTLVAVTNQYQQRAAKLRSVRRAINLAGERLRAAEVREASSSTLMSRFKLLKDKYESDLSRLGAIDEGVAYFQAIDSIDCPLCGAPVDQHRHGGLTSPREPGRQRAAVAGEANKIRALKGDLDHVLEAEGARLRTYQIEVEDSRSELESLALEERRALQEGQIEFTADPTELAVRRSELSGQLDLFEEAERLENEVQKIRASKRVRSAPVERYALQAARSVAADSKALLQSWGLAVHDVEVDTAECDLKVNGRDRLSFGAGMRSLFRASLTIAMLKHAMEQGHPHLGVVVIDSPLKAYADPKATRPGDEGAPLATVRERFYSWLATWKGPGQVVILENEPPPPEIASELNMTEFFGPNAEEGQRAGFFPGLPSQSPSTS